MLTPEENLKSIIEEIMKNEIMLPDFQRQFDWEIDKQKKLVASVLTKLPVGGILLLKANSTDYKSKRLGLDPQIGVSGKAPSKTYFLLDGQQRMTCLTNVFSDVIQEASEKKVSRLASKQLLATRFYIRVDRWSPEIEDGSQRDIFGIRSLEFRFDVSKDQEPDFLTADIIEKIECRSFSAGDYKDKPFMPCQKYKDSLDDYCFETDGCYLIPLFLLVSTSASDDKLRKKRLNSIINRITEQIKESISTYHTNLESGEKESFALSVLSDPDDIKDYKKSKDKDSTFDEKLNDKADLWKGYFQAYLYSCVENLKLNKIEMPEGSRERAIDIYENMNMGGLSLSTLDLVAARVAKASHESLYERISNCLTEKRKYNLSSIPVELLGKIPDDYNASRSIGAVDNRINKSCSDLFLEVLGLYCNNKDYNPEKAKCQFSKAAEILKLDENDINDNCEKVCVAIDRTFCFLKTRCGVQSLSDVNYKLMMRLIAYIFTNDKWYKNPSIHDKLEAWYWTAVFSGEYDKDQNDRFESNLKNMLESLTVKSKGYDWIVSMEDSVLEKPYFSDCSFLLMEKANEDRVPKEHLGKYFCQFYLSRPYSDLITDKRKNDVFCDRKLEKHHIIPLGSVAKIGESSNQLRKNKNHILNSPLNYVYISDLANGTISDKSLKEYEDAITPSAKSSLGIMKYPKVKDLDDDDKIKEWLRDRHETIKGLIQNRINVLLASK